MIFQFSIMTYELLLLLCYEKKEKVNGLANDCAFACAFLSRVKQIRHFS